MTGLPPKDPPRDPGQPTLARGATIGRYVVLGLVGRGGMGEVYAAYDPELDRKVAVKLLRVKPGAGVSLSEGRQRTLDGGALGVGDAGPQPDFHGDVEGHEPDSPTAEPGQWSSDRSQINS